MRRLALVLTAMAAHFDVTTALSKDSRYYSESAVATAKIEGAQHYEELEKQGVLSIARSVVIRGRAPDGKPLKKNEKLLHLIRHGQGFHNLLGDVYATSRRVSAATRGTAGGGGSENAMATRVRLAISASIAAFSAALSGTRFGLA